MAKVELREPNRTSGWFSQTLEAPGAPRGEAEVLLGGLIGKTTEVGTYPHNPWGLFDTFGNVWEWVEDCYHGSYDGASADGTAWTESCLRSGRVVRGGSWGSGPELARSAIRG